MIELRPAESDEDLEAWRSVRSAVLPNERTSSVAELRAGTDWDTLWLLAYVDDVLAGSGIANSSSTGGAFTQPRVLPAFRRPARGAQLGRVRGAIRVHRAEPPDRAGLHGER